MIEKQEAFPSLVEPEEHLEESYAILIEGLIEFLNSPGRTLEIGEPDYLKAVREKVLYSIGVVASDEDRHKLQELMLDANEQVVVHFAKLYDGLVNEDELPEREDNIRANLLYRFFFSERRGNIIQILVDRAIKDRKRLIAAYKGDVKKDFLISQLRTELGGKSFMKDPSNLYLIAAYREIFSEFIGDQNCDFEEATQSLPMGYESFATIQKIFEFANGCEVYQRFVSGVVESEAAPSMEIDFRDALIERLTDEFND